MSTKKPFRVFYYRGIEADKLVDVTQDQLLDMLHSRGRRKFKRGSVNQHLLKRLRIAKTKLDAEGRPKIIKTHLRNQLILPEMLGSQVGVYQGLGYYLVDCKAPMVGHYLGEFSLTYAPVKHGEKKQKGKGETSHKFIPV